VRVLAGRRRSPVGFQRLVVVSWNPFMSRNTMSLWRDMTFSCRITQRTELMWWPLPNGYVRQA